MDDARARTEPEREMAGYLAKVATGPRLSKDLTRDQARRAMAMILAEQVDPVQAGALLVALRMKRESHEELAGVLDALRASGHMATADVPELVDVAEPYNGYVRHAPAAPFLPAVLAACDVPTVLHGCRDLAPKFGVTAHRVLQAAGAPVNASVASAARAVAEAGWAYVDVARYNPPLARLARLRRLLVKRPCLSLLEKLTRPIAARQRTHLWIGYTHREYPDILAGLARDVGYHSMLATRGVEGGVLTSLAGKARALRYLTPGEHEGAQPTLEELSIEPSDADITSALRAPALPGVTAAQTPHGQAVGVLIPESDTLQRWAEHAAQAGRDALAGTPGPTADALTLGAAAMLRHLGRVESLAQGARRARAALASGRAAERFAGFTAELLTSELP